MFLNKLIWLDSPDWYWNSPDDWTGLASQISLEKLSKRANPTANNNLISLKYLCLYTVEIKQ